MSRPKRPVKKVGKQKLLPDYVYMALGRRLSDACDQLKRSPSGKAHVVQPPRRDIEMKHINLALAFDAGLLSEKPETFRVIVSIDPVLIDFLASDSKAADYALQHAVGMLENALEAVRARMR